MVKMKTLMIPLVLLLLVPLGCGGEEEEAQVQTSTMSPAVPVPDEDDDDAVITQTTEIGEERSPNEGGVLTNERYQSTDTSTTTAEPPRP